MPDLNKIVRPFVPFQIGVTTVIATPRKSLEDSVKLEVPAAGENSRSGSSSRSISATGYAEQVQKEQPE